MLAIIKGISRGFIMAVFSFIAIIIGVAAAMKLSYIVANWLQHSFNTGKQWLPFLSFLIVLIGVIILSKLDCKSYTPRNKFYNAWMAE